MEHSIVDETGDPRVSAQTGTQAVDRAAALLVQILESDQPQQFGALVTAGQLPKSTTSRLLGALERHGLVQRNRGGAFQPGVVITRYARRGGATADLAELARPHLDRVGQRTGETVNLAVPGPDAVEQIAQVDSRFMLGAINWVGRSVPFHCTAVGKVFLAHGVADLPAGRLDRRTDRTITTRAALAVESERTRQRGYAVASEELEPGLVAVAAPVHGSDGRVVAALSVSGPTARITPDRIDAIGELLAATAGSLSAALGHQKLGHQSKEGAA